MDMTSMLLLALGLALGAVVGAALTRAGRGRLEAERANALREVQRLAAETAVLSARASAAEAAHAATFATLESERVAAAQRLDLVRSEQERLLEQFSALSADALRHNNEAFLTLADERFKAAQAVHAGDLEQRKVAVETLVAPLRETLGKVEVQLRELESARVAAYTSLTEQVGFVRQSSEQLRTETTALVTALRAPQARGRWGEMQLRRVVDVAGMQAHVDFDEQASAIASDGSTVRPDMVVRLAGGKNVVVDSKVTLAAYLEAAETTDPDVRANRLAAHARHLRKHVEDLSAKAYWAQFSPAPEFVVLFVPGEAFLAPALEHDPTLLELAMSKKVIIATPTTLMTLLRTVGYAWQQAALTDNAKEVFNLGRELYDRLGKLGTHVDKLGRSISRVVGDYNTAVSSLESRVLVSARKMAELHVVDGPLDGPRPVEDATRSLSNAVLLDSIIAARQVRALPAPAAAEPDLVLESIAEDPRFGLVDDRSADTSDGSDGSGVVGLWG
jgi:DNA recombination protein RmuC